MTCLPPFTRSPQVHSVTCFELPVYHPSPAEKADPKLYAANVRKLMVSGAAHSSRGCRFGISSGGLLLHFNTEVVA